VVYSIKTTGIAHISKTNLNVRDQRTGRSRRVYEQRLKVLLPHETTLVSYLEVVDGHLQNTLQWFQHTLVHGFLQDMVYRGAQTQTQHKNSFISHVRREHRHKHNTRTVSFSREDGSKTQTPHKKQFHFSRLDGS
jgi:hypothetical protein